MRLATPHFSAILDDIIEEEEHTGIRPIFKPDYFSEAEPSNTVLRYPIEIAF